MTIIKAYMDLLWSIRVCDYNQTTINYKHTNL